MEFGLENTFFLDFTHADFWYFEKKCFSGDTQISGVSSPKLQYIAYIAHPLSRIPKDLLESGNRYSRTRDEICDFTQKFYCYVCKVSSTQ